MSGSWFLFSLNLSEWNLYVWEVTDRVYLTKAIKINSDLFFFFLRFYYLPHLFLIGINYAWVRRTISVQLGYIRYTALRSSTLIRIWKITHFRIPFFHVPYVHAPSSVFLFYLILSSPQFSFRCACKHAHAHIHTHERTRLRIQKQETIQMSKKKNCLYLYVSYFFSMDKIVDNLRKEII